MKLGYDFELNEKRRRSENYVRPAYDPYPIPENEPHAQNPIPENEPHAQTPIPENEPHAQNPIYAFKGHKQDPVEVIDDEWNAIYSMLKVAHICEDIAKRYRDLGDVYTEEAYLIEANHAQESANLLYILTHK